MAFGFSLDFSGAWQVDGPEDPSLNYLSVSGDLPEGGSFNRVPKKARN